MLHGFGKLKPAPVPVHTRDTLSRVYPYPCHALHIIISSESQLEDFVRSVRSFYATFKTKLVYAYCESLQVTLPSADDPVLPGLIHLLKSCLCLQELAVICDAPDFPEFVIKGKLSNLKKILIHYDPVSKFNFSF